MRKYIAECIGTLVLVAMGCGTAMLVGTDAAAGSGYLLTALAFGLAVVAMAYCMGNISGCHVNPAISVAAFIRGDINGKDLAGYIIAQVIGAIVGAFFLKFTFELGGVTDMTGAFGSNGLAGVNGSAYAGLLVEMILTFIFVLVFLGATSKKAAHGSFAGLIIGLSLFFVHILGIGLTGTSVNPARSIGPAFVAFCSGNAVPLESLGIFVFAPIIGAILAEMVYGLLEKTPN